LEGKPVVVLSNNDGCVISRSEEAKKLGIRMGAPFFKINEVVGKSNVMCFSTNFPLYGDISSRVMDIIRRETPGIEVYSIDEAFIDFRGVSENEISILGKSLVAKIKKGVGVPVSLGVSNTKTLAKVATKLSKKYPATKGFCLMNKEADIAKVLKKFPIEDVWGIGRSYSKMLISSGVISAADFLSKNELWVDSRMGITGLKTWRELWGEHCIVLEDGIPDKKQICTSRSFATELYDLEDLYKAVSTFSSNSAEKLRRQRCVCREIIVFIHTNRFKENVQAHNQSALISLSEYTDSSITIGINACNGLKDIFRDGCGYKKCGVILSSIIRKTDVIPSLFESLEEKDRDSSLMSVMDEINTKYGKNSLVTAAAGIERIKANQNLLSKRYTTSWDDIIEVNT
jgi:DNA polymerase V